MFTSLTYFTLGEEEDPKSDISETREKSIIKIQSLVRGYITRKNMKEKGTCVSLSNDNENRNDNIKNVLKDDDDISDDDISDDDENSFYILHVNGKPISHILHDRNKAYNTMWEYARKIKFDHSHTHNCYIREKSSCKLEVTGCYQFLAVSIDHVISTLELFKVSLRV